MRTAVLVVNWIFVSLGLYVLLTSFSPELIPEEAFYQFVGAVMLIIPCATTLVYVHTKDMA